MLPMTEPRTESLWHCAIAVVAALLMSSLPALVRAGDTSRAACEDTSTRQIPARAPDAPGGRQFAQTIAGLTGDDREAMISRELLAANIPQFLRHFVPISLTARQEDGRTSNIVVCAAPDYLAIGSDQDHVLMPMRLQTALQVADRFGLSLPTPKVVDAIYAQATVRLTPQPLPASDEMRSTFYLVHHNDLVAAQRDALGAPVGALTAGHKKDLVLTNLLWQKLDRVAIYGWHSAPSAPIQPLSTVHGWRYADYSHGARLIATRVWVDGVQRSLFDLLQDPILAPALSKEGGIRHVVRLIQELSGHTHGTLAAD
jgi:hypothetical protein